MMSDELIQKFKDSKTQYLINSTTHQLINSTLVAIH